MKTTLAISLSQQQARKIITKYKKLKRKKKSTGYKNAKKKSKDVDVVFLKQVPLHPRQRLARMDKQDEKDVESIKLVPLHTRQRLARKNKQDEKDVEFIKRFPLHPRQWLIRKTQKLKHPRDKLREKELQIARNNVLALMRKKIDFTAKKLLNKILLFDSSRVNEELIMDKTI